MASKLPSEKKSVMDQCVNRPGGSDMAKFRRGLGCVLDSYGIVVNNRVCDLFPEVIPNELLRSPSTRSSEESRRIPNNIVMSLVIAASRLGQNELDRRKRDFS